ncbi:MAG: hypothetical protein E6R04_07960 [Spirochaetes bacterium]|nr:MAG: hypothetical protein E6R04_07960 [Spirochaetota bacterium]
MSLFKPGQTVTTIPGAYQAEREASLVTCLADAGVLEVQTLTFLAASSSGQGDYAVISSLSPAETFGIWLDKDANGTEPTGAAYVAVDNEIQVAIVTGNTAAQVATAVYTACNGNIPGVTVTNPSSGVVRFTQTIGGNATAPAVHNTGDTGAGSIVAATVTGGVASSLNNKYITFRGNNNAAFNCWLNINSEGVDPSAPGTAIEATAAIGASAADIASAMATAIDGNAHFEAETYDTASFKIFTAATGAATDVGAGNSGFSVSVTRQGHAKVREPGDTVASITGPATEPTSW